MPEEEEEVVVEEALGREAEVPVEETEVSEPRRLNLDQTLPSAAVASLSIRIHLRQLGGSVCTASARQRVREERENVQV